MWEYMPVAHAYIILTYILCKMSHGVCNNRQVLIKNLMALVNCPTWSWLWIGLVLWKKGFLPLSDVIEDVQVKFT